MVKERERQVRESLDGELQKLSADAPALDLVKDIRILEDFVENFANARIADARAAGASWADIARVLGVSRQAVHKRFAARRQDRARLELRFERKKR